MRTRPEESPATRRGQALVETALVLPILLLILMLGIDLGRAFFTTVQLRNAAHEATMFGGTQPDAPCTDVAAVVDDEMDRTDTSCVASGTGVFIASADSAPETTPPLTCGTSGTELLNYSVRLEFRFQPALPFVGFLTGNGMGGAVPLAAENTGPVLISYEC